MRRFRKGFAWFRRVCFTLALLLMAKPCLESAQTNQVNIKDFGAINDGKTVNTLAIQRAIDHCAKLGGGTIIIPEGVFVTGSIFLRQGVVLKISQGAILKGSTDTNDYPWIKSRIAGFEMVWPAGLVNAIGLSNVTITGPGTIDGSGERWWKEYWTARESDPDRMDPHFRVARPRLVHILNCTNLTVQRLQLINSPFWHLQVTYCDKVYIADITVRAPQSPIRAASSDGIDIDSSCNVIIERCDIECADDAICMKSGRDADGLRVSRPTENVIVRDCRVGPAAGLVVFGSETAGGIKNVHIYNCRADPGCEEIVRFKTRMGRGGVVENIVYENIIGEGIDRVFNFNMDALSSMWVPEEFRQPVPPELGTPKIRNVTVRNLKVKKSSSAGRIVGLTNSPIVNLTLENVDLEVTSGGPIIKHVHNLQSVNVVINGKEFTWEEQNSTMNTR